jgi:LytS/YehU family sensor histidine kinase
MNTIYYKIDRSNTLAREMLGDFSEMLRYQLYECNRERVPLQKELRFLQSYIELQKARLSENYSIRYEVTGETDSDCTIAPFLFLPLIENCFKFVSNFPDRKNEISIRIHFSPDEVLLETENSYEPVSEKTSGGIGLENVKRRLELLYPQKHNLETISSGNMFTVKLKINGQ